MNNEQILLNNVRPALTTEQYCIWYDDIRRQEFRGSDFEVVRAMAERYEEIEKTLRY